MKDELEVVRRARHVAEATFEEKLVDVAQLSLLVHGHVEAALCEQIALELTVDDVVAVNCAEAGQGRERDVGCAEEIEGVIAHERVHIAHKDRGEGDSRIGHVARGSAHLFGVVLLKGAHDEPCANTGAHNQ